MMNNIRVPPNNIEAEMAVLSAMMINPLIITRVNEVIQPRDLYREANENICKACFDLKENTNAVSLGAWLTERDLYEKCGGYEYLAGLVDAVPTSAGYGYHCEIIKNLSIRRQKINHYSVQAEKCYQLHTDLEEIEVEDRAQILGPAKKDYKTNLELINQGFKIIEERSKKDGGSDVGLSTGFENIDSNLHGMENKCTYYLKAESGTGKSALALNIGENIATNYQGNVLFFTMESTDLALTFRRMAIHTRIALTRIRMGNIRNEGEWEALTTAANELSGSNMIIIENSKYRFFETLQNFCESFSQDSKILFIIIDFLQYIHSKVKHSSRHLELSYISDCFNFLAKDLNCPVLIISQVNKDYQTKECISSGSLVYTNKGPKVIKKLYKIGKTPTFQLRSYNFTSKKTEYIIPKEIIHTGEKTCFKVKTKSGKTLVVSKDTPLYNGSNWVKAKDLIVGDKVLVDLSIKPTAKGASRNTGKTQFSKNQVPWNKGLNKDSDIRVKRNADNHKGVLKQRITGIDFSVNARKGHPPQGRKSNKGYVLIYKPGWPSAYGHEGPWHGYIFEHRYLMEKHLGRILEDSEIIHHLDGDKKNNTMENLLLCENSSAHGKIHQLEQTFVETLIKKGKVYYDRKSNQFKFR